MKKAVILFAAALLCLAGTQVQAQKQIGGDKNLEFQFSPLGGNPIGINGLRFRLFNSENSAIRVNFFLGSSTITDVISQEGAINAESPVSPMLQSYDRAFDFTIRPGYEIHFDGTDRLSPYVGAEIDFGVGSTSTETEKWSLDNLTDLSVGKNVVWSETEGNSYTRLGINLLAGFDYYFTDNLYLGAELGFGFSNTSFGDDTFEVSNTAAWSYGFSGGATLGEDLPAAVVNGSEFNVGPTVNGRIRLGFLIN